MKHRKRIQQVDSETDSEKSDVEVVSEQQQKPSKELEIRKDPVVIEIIDDDDDNCGLNFKMISAPDASTSTSVVHDDPKVLIKIGGKRVEPELFPPKQKEKRRYPILCLLIYHNYVVLFPVSLLNSWSPIVIVHSSSNLHFVYYSLWTADARYSMTRNQYWNSWFQPIAARKVILVKGSFHAQESSKK
jgi:hypothetical protein